MDSTILLPPDMRWRTCPCETTFAIPAKGPAPLLCPECRPVHYQTNARIESPVRQCEDCPTEFEINPKGGMKKFLAALKGPMPKRCPECREEHKNDYRAHLAAPIRETFICAGCKREFPLVRKGYSRKRCDECAPLRQADQAQAWKDAHPEYRSVMWRRKKHRRRARMAGVESEQFDYREVFERDRWICQICGWKIRADATYIDPETGRVNLQYATLDHVVPLSQGGAHTRANSRLACWGCNSERGNRGGNEQLALI